MTRCAGLGWARLGRGGLAVMGLLTGQVGGAVLDSWLGWPWPSWLVLERSCSGSRLLADMQLQQDQPTWQIADAAGLGVELVS